MHDPSKINRPRTPIGEKKEKYEASTIIQGFGVNGTATTDGEKNIIIRSELISPFYH